jgi:hypothetical protein
MAGNTSLQDLMADPGAVVNQRAKMMQQLQHQSVALRKMGFEPQEIDLLLRGKVGALKPDEGDAYSQVMRKFAIMSRVGSVPGMTKSLQGYPGGGPTGPNPAAQRQQMMQESLQGLGFGGGGMSLDDLMK